MADSLERFGPNGRVGGQHLRDRGQRIVAVEQQGEKLLTQHPLEFLQGQATVFGAHLAQFVEGSFVHPRSGHADVDQTANHCLPDAAFGDARLQFGHALANEGDPFRLHAGTPARGFVRRLQPDQRLQQRGAVNRQEDLLQAAVTQIPPAVEGGDHPVRDYGLPLEQRVVGRDGLPLFSDLPGQLGDLLHQRVAIREQHVGQFGRLDPIRRFDGSLALGERLDERLEQRAIKAEIDFGYPPHGGETALVFGARLNDSPQIGQRARFEADDPVAAD